MKTVSLLILMALGLGLVGTAVAQPSDAAPVIDTPPTTSTKTSTPPAEAAKGLFESVKGGHWLLAFGFFSMLLGSISRWAFAQKWAFWESKTGGYTIAGVFGLATLGAGIVESGGFSVDLVVTALLVVLSAMGMHGPAKGAKGLVKKSDYHLQNV